ncbi:MAG TPA: hypothetical protein VK539_16535 [Myxococcaceae bacterium]|nr:hypothetical protein [Myxococcaceae bacterium]
MGIGGIISGAASKAANAAAAAAAAAKAAAEAAAGAAAKATEKVSEGAQKVGEKVSTFASERARDVYEGAKEGISAATGKAKDVGEDVTDRARQAAGSAANTAQGVVDFSRDVFEDAKDVAGDAGKALAGVARKAGPVLDKGTDLAAAGLDALGETIQNAPAADPISKVGNEVVGGLLQTSADVVRDPVETAKAVKDAASLNRQVDSLKPGEHVKVGLSAEGDVSGVGLKGKGELEVKHAKDANGQGDGYTVSVNGELGVGLVGKLGATGAAEVGGSAFLNGGAKVELKFATAEEAKRAADIIAKSTLVGATGAANPMLAPVTGAAANQVLGNPLSDLKDLGKNLNAVEFKLGIDAEGSASVGVDGLENAATASAKAGINGSLGQTGRLEFKEGQPTKLAVKQTWQAGGEAGGSLGLGLPKSESGSVSLPTNASAGAKGSFKVEFEQTFELPKDFDAQSLLKDPAGATRQLAQTARATHEGKLTLTDSREAHAKALGVGGRTGSEVKVELKGKVQDLANSGAFESAVQGDFAKAYSQLQGSVQSKATVQDKTTASTDLGIGFHAGAAGGEVGLHSERTHLGQEQQLSPSQLAELYAEQLEAVQRVS